MRRTFEVITLKQTRKDLAQLFSGIGVEVGVEQGLFSEQICKVPEVKKLYAIDPWKAYKGYRDHVNQEKLNKFYEISKKRLKNYNCEIVRKFSVDAADDFLDGSLDFVYIDANHDYQHVYEDLTLWSKKVKKGGIVAGHDYIRRKNQSNVYAVVKAVNDFVNEHKIEELTVYRGDTSPSWMFISTFDKGPQESLEEELSERGLQAEKSHSDNKPKTVHYLISDPLHSAGKKDVQQNSEQKNNGTYFANTEKGTVIENTDRPTETLNYILNKLKINYDSGTKMPIEIPEIGRYGLADLFAELGFKHGAEIGVFDGTYSEVLCKANPKAKLYSIDPWAPHPNYTAFLKEETFVKAYQKAKERLSKYNCQMIKKPSLEAVKDFADETLDFVYIDGDHSFQACTNDIVEWTKKVKIGGIVAGHDYIKHLPRSIIHVYEAVNGYTEAYAIRPWFILAAKAVINGVISPEERTFLWIKAPFPTPRSYD